ncbi:MAG TPA: hypothetical protein VM661_16490, partial [Candidatus Sulfotelmatobacter sp.]|nr:hypothetical protein [Candidatus Sulfotelmatobacter sp.]
PTLKSKLIQYNKEDCMAVKVLCDFLSAVEARQPSAEGCDRKTIDIATTESLPKPQRKWPVFGKPNFVLKDLERASECAYFDYQRDRVYVRTEKRFKGLN